MDPERIRIIREGKSGSGPVIYWMSRDQRIRDNWALFHAQESAIRQERPLLVVFCLVPHFLDAATRQYGFLLRGLEEIEAGLRGLLISFCLLEGLPGAEIPALVSRRDACLLVSDFDPLRIKRIWQKEVSQAVRVPFHEVDAHNIVPCWRASGKPEYGAYTLRPKIRKLLPAFLREFPRLKKHPLPFDKAVNAIDWKQLRKRFLSDISVPEVNWLEPGEKAARRALSRFVRTGLPSYAINRNDPSVDGQSGLSPYLHFGHLSAQRVALAAIKARAPKEARDAFLEELIVRRELSDNFCFYNPDYDNTAGFPAWARRTLYEHLRDRREYLYTPAQLERAETHDPLWNAAQTEMKKQGKMHGYLRMYWAKKILQWSSSPEQAMETAIFLNNKYELDGRDPNGYAGIAWSIGGVHDRAWNEREIFGKIRYMSYNGCRGKFDVRAYIEKVNGLKP